MTLQQQGSTRIYVLARQWQDQTA